MQGVDPAFNQGPDALRCFAERRAKEISEWLRKHEAKRLYTLFHSCDGFPWPCMGAAANLCWQGEISGWAVLDDINLSMTDEAAVHRGGFWLIRWVVKLGRPEAACRPAGDRVFEGFLRTPTKADALQMHLHQKASEGKAVPCCTA